MTSSPFHTLGASTVFTFFVVTVVTGLCSLPLSAKPSRAPSYKEDGKTRYTSTALSILQKFLPVPPRTVVLCEGVADGVDTDGYCIDVRKNEVRITGEGKGVVYGACSFLQRYLDMDYWGEGEYYIPEGEKKMLPEGKIIDNPSMSYRQSQSYMLRDTLYKWWYRLEEPSEEFVSSYWVHTCDRLLPASRYGKEHPEYYAYFGGKRHPGSASQWCMSNPEVLEIVCGRLDSLFKANPGLNMISVSQNDGSDTYCRCPECQKILDEEGAPSGPVIRFVNKVAQRFPDKTISTLAYLFTMQPPKVTKPRENVSIMLCDIDCRRQTSLKENPSGQNFMKALEGWSRISDNIFVWDYGINFDNYLSPFPNFSTLWDNMQIFKEHGVRMHFSQIASVRGGDFAELRTYLVSNLMWNADTPLRDLMGRFLERYYGKAAKPIYDYVKLMEGAAVGTDVDLFIYDSPVSYKGNILRPTLLTRYNRLFDEAESLVQDDPVRLARVRRSRLPLMYSSLELARTDPDMDREIVRFDLEKFRKAALEFKVEMLNERRNDPSEYCDLYLRRYLDDVRDNLAYGASVHYDILPGKKYLPLSVHSLTDGLFGGTTFVENWVGWEGIDADFTLDLGREVTVSEISTDFLRQLGAWILIPEKVQYFLSPDGKDFSEVMSVDIPEDRGSKVEFIPIGGKLSSPVEARYLRVYVTGTKVCPQWHYGVGNPCWFFIDEVIVR